VIKIERWPTDYGNGPNRWYVTNGSLRAVEPLQCLLHPIKAFRLLVLGVYSD
jgi:hypothetical protein